MLMEWNSILSAMSIAIVGGLVGIFLIEKFSNKKKKEKELK